jgi:hypothetical protein
MCIASFEPKAVRAEPVIRIGEHGGKRIKGRSKVPLAPAIGTAPLQYGCHVAHFQDDFGATPQQRLLRQHLEIVHNFVATWGKVEKCGH